MKSMIRLLSITAFFLVANVGLRAQSQQPQEQGTTGTPSLGDYARRVRANKAQTAPKPAKVITNDDLPSRPPDLGATTAGSASSGATGQTGTTTAIEPTASSSGLDEKYYRKAIADLRAKLETHQRELDVLKQKLSQNAMQYYPDPNKTLNQELTRGDVTKLTGQVGAKQQEVEADQKAIEDLEDQFRRQGGKPGVLREILNAPVQTEPTIIQPQPEKPPSTNQQEKPEDKKQTKDYWQSRFKTARNQLARAEEQEKLVQDELDLLQIQQARELDPSVQDEVKKKIVEKTTQLETARSVVAKAQAALETLDAQFRDSGAPDDWKPQA